MRKVSRLLCFLAATSIAAAISAQTTPTPTSGIPQPTVSPTAGVGTTTTVTPMVTVTPAPGGAPTSADQCRNGGWRNFTNPSFKNQGDCVSYVASQGRAGGNPRATPTPTP
jgi:hypothetical protein